MSEINLDADHAEQSNVDNSKLYAQRVTDGDYRAYHTLDGRVLLDIGGKFGDVATEGCPFPGCCIPAGSCG